MSNTRIEEDSVGKKEVPVEAYYGVQALRAVENFPITGRMMHPEMIRALAYQKKASAITNQAAGVMDTKVADAIVRACDMIIDGKFHDQFVVDPIQGGAGTSMNMNANEVIANVAIEILGGTKGDYSIVHPNDHVNYGQSTNDVVPTAGKIATLTLLEKLEGRLVKLQEAFLAKAEEFDDVLKMGRTQMEDAVPIRLGQEFAAYASAIGRCLKRIQLNKEELYSVNMGGTAIGTGLNADAEYYRNISATLAAVTGMPFVQAGDLIDATQNIDCFASVHSAVKNCAIAMSKIANDLRLMGSGPKTGFGEINLPARQNGSSIMPGKVNPVIPEVVSQVAFKIIGNDMTIAMAAEGGQLELNAFEPVTFQCLFESIDMMTNAIDTFIANCINGITANAEHCRDLLESSVGMVTALCPHIGYAKAAHLAKDALKRNIPIRKLILDEKVLTEKELEIILDAKKMTAPGISGREMLENK